MQRTKKKFLKRFIFLALLIFVVLEIVNVTYESYVIPESMTYRKELQYQEAIQLRLEGPGIKYLFVGDSHTGNAANPQFIPGGFNYHSSAATYAEVYYKLRRNYHYNYTIENTFIEIDLPMFYREPTLTDWWYYINFMSYSEIAEVTNKNIANVFLQTNYPVLGNGKNFVMPTKIRMKKGWMNETGNFSNNKDRRKDAESQVNELFTSNDMNKRALKYFFMSAQLAFQKNTTLYLIRYPVTKDFDQSFHELRPNISYSDKYSFIYNELDQKGIDYHILDYYDIYFNNTDLFQNSDHLNYRGANILSKKIYADLTHNHSNEFP